MSLAQDFGLPTPLRRQIRRLPTKRRRRHRRPLPEVQPDRAVAAGFIPAVPAKNDADLLALVRQANQELYASLESFVCNEDMRRFKGRITGESSSQIDQVTAKVSFENGFEQYSDIRQNEHARQAIWSVGGAWSTGEFGTLLRQTEDLLKTQTVLFRRYTDLDGTAAAVYGMEVSEQDSPWDLQVRSEHYRVPFQTEVWVSRATGQVLKLERTSTSIPPGMGISEIRWGIALQDIELSGRMWMLPKTGEYTVLYEESGRREWNELTFTNYHRYGSEVALRFQ